MPLVKRDFCGALLPILPKQEIGTVVLLGKANGLNKKNSKEYQGTVEFEFHIHVLSSIHSIESGTATR